MGVPRPSASALRPPLCATPWVCGDARGCSGIAVGPSRWLGVAGVCGFNFSADFSLPESHRAQSPTEAFQNAKHGSQFARSRCRAGFGVQRVAGNVFLMTRRRRPCTMYLRVVPLLYYMYFSRYQRIILQSVHAISMQRRRFTRFLSHRVD